MIYTTDTHTFSLVRLGTILSNPLTGHFCCRFRVIRTTAVRGSAWSVPSVALQSCCFPLRVCNKLALLFPGAPTIDQN